MGGVNDTRYWAHHMAKLGIRVFPLFGVIDGQDEATGLPATHSAGSGKKPRLRGPWPEYATTDAAQIDAWFDEFPHMNYACVTGEGFYVMDCDSQEAVVRFDDIFEEREGVQNDTFFVATAQGGHNYFRGDSKTHKPTDDTDIKGRGGYVVGPGSTSWNGTTYRVVNPDAPIKDAPYWLGLSVVERKDTDALEGSEFNPDMTRDEILSLIGGLIRQVGFDAAKVAFRGINQMLRDPYPDPDEAWFNESQRRSLNENAGVGLRAAADYAAWKGFTDQDESKARYFMRETDRRMKPPPVWTYDGVIPEYGVCQLYGPSYSGKSFVAIDLALRLCNGEDWMGYGLVRQDKDHVLYVMAEGAWDFQQRVNAWCELHEGSADNLITVEEQVLDLGSLEGWLELFREAQQDADMQQAMDRLGLLIIDTQSLMIYAEENSNTDMNRALQNIKAASKALRCPILLVHHCVDADPEARGRGASAIFAGADVVIHLQGAVDKSLVIKKVKAGQLPQREALFSLVAVGNSAAVGEITLEDIIPERITFGIWCDSLHAWLVETPNARPTASECLAQLGIDNDIKRKNRDKVLTALRADDRFEVHDPEGQGQSYRVSLRGEG